MTFLTPPLVEPPLAMAKTILGLSNHLSWSPHCITWHNTGVPSLGLWDRPGYPRQNWIAGLNAYYRNMGWHSGPHFCGTPDSAIMFCDPLADGVHCSCENHIAFGVETIGNFTPGGDDPRSPRGLASMTSSATIIAALCLRFGWSVDASHIHFHRQCTNDHHACPGSLVTDTWAILLITQQMEIIKHANI